MSQLNNITIEDATIKVKQLDTDLANDTEQRDPVIVLESLLGMLYRKHYKEIQQQLLQLEKQMKIM